MLVGVAVFASKKIWDSLEDNALSQLVDAACVPGTRRVIGTPDLHLGYGVPIGCVLAMENAVIPAAVGYDINCGMRLITTPLTASEADTKELARSIRRDIPLGEGMSNVRVSKSDLAAILAGGIGALGEVEDTSHKVWEFRDKSEEAADLRHVEDNGSLNGDTSAVSQHAAKRGRGQLATLGGGNHFIELQRVDEIADADAAKRFGLFEGQLVVMIHSGSRGLGHQVGGEYMKKAASMTLSECPNSHLCYMHADSKEGKNYIGAMNAAANFAFVNRQLMTVLVRKNFRHYHGDIPMPLVYDVPHNMAKLETHGGGNFYVHRKGATRAFDAARMAGTPFAETGQPALIPGSMGTASYLLLSGERAHEGLFSVNHGAGRVMSRKQAAGVWKKGRCVRQPAISRDDFEASMEGITLLCKNRREILEEAPGAYKDIDVVIETVTGAGLGRVVARLVPLAVLKG
jgi:tRNA-splicing ligase RtcB